MLYNIDFSKLFGILIKNKFSYLNKKILIKMKKEMNSFDLELFNKLKEFIAKKLKIEPKNITLKTNFQNDLGLNHMRSLQLLQESEDEFKIRPFKEEERREIKKIEDFLSAIKTKKLEKEKWDKLSIEERAREIICEKLGVEKSEVTLDAHFTNDLGADSLDMVEVIMELEKEFKVGIPDDKAEEIQTFGDGITYLEENISRN